MEDSKGEELFKQLRSIDMANVKEELLSHLQRLVKRQVYGEQR
jgi:hypothetical protein